MRRFYLQRDEDASGVSGTGVVAEGVEFTDGTCAMRWRTATTSTAVYGSAQDVVTVHGHEGRTRLVWLDEHPIPDPPDASAGPIEVKSRPGDATRFAAELPSRRQQVIARLRRSYP